MSEPIKAIETRYAGCRFRSRLEARWAVFFDTLGIAWEYEPQGYELEWRLSGYDEPLHYLPDFWLPDLDLWAEVKGSLTIPECERLLNIAASLSDNGHDMIILGNLPHFEPIENGLTVTHLPWRLHMNGDDGYLYLLPWHPADHNDVIHLDTSTVVAGDCGGPWPDITRLFPWAHRLPEILINEGATGAHSARNEYLRALTAARSARFEHGESG